MIEHRLDVPIDSAPRRACRVNPGLLLEAAAWVNAVERVLREETPAQRNRRLEMHRREYRGYR